MTYFSNQKWMCVVHGLFDNSGKWLARVTWPTEIVFDLDQHGCCMYSVVSTWYWFNIWLCVLREVLWQVTPHMSITFHVYNVYLTYMCFCWHFKGSCSWLANEEFCYGSTYQSKRSESTKSKRQKLHKVGVLLCITYFVLLEPHPTGRN